jgi:aarF domain-containing kinase
MVSLDYKMSLRGLAEDTPEYEAKIKTVHLRSAQRLLDLCLTNAGLYIKVLLLKYD